MVKQTVIYTYNGILLSKKKESNFDTCNKLDESQGIILGEKNQSQKVHPAWFHIYNILKMTKL